MIAIQDHVLRDLLTECDYAAATNVRAGNGGPFAASLHVYNQSTDVMQPIAGPVGNAVLEIGLASAHAEDRLIVSENIEKLKAVLKTTGLSDAHVYAVSSGESCPACHAKLEILARKLMHEKLLMPGRFTVVYGASYEDTHKVAGFDDFKYHDDFQRPVGSGLVRQSFEKFTDLPEMLRIRIHDASSPTAWIVAKDRVLVGTGDNPEIEVIHMASKMQQRAHIDEPWNLRRATLYSFTHDIGPMAYAECQWANVTNWVSIQHPDAKVFATEEAPEISNATLFKIIATRPYTHMDSALSFLHLTPFDNLGQQEWRDNPKAKHYNGV